MSNPRVTVLMPVFNGESHVRASIESMLAQTFGDFELLIVDDGSTDATSAIAHEYRDPRVRVMSFDRNRGLATALNAGLEATRTPLIARQDADDLSERDRLAVQVEEFERDPSLALIGSQATTIDESGRCIGIVRRPLEPRTIRWYSLLDNPFIHSSVMYSRDAVRALGGFDLAYDPFSQDWELWSRLIRRHASRNLDARLVAYRVTHGSIMAMTEHASDSQARFHGIVSAIVTANVESEFGRGDVARQDATILAGYITGIPRDRVGDFLDAFERLLGSFVALHPAEDRSASDFSATLARQLDAIAFRVTPPGRHASWQAYRRVLHLGPSVVRQLPWGRALALLTVGKCGRHGLGAIGRRLR